MLAGISGTLSFMGSSYIVISCLLLTFGIVKQSTQTTNVSLVLSLSLADFFSSFSYMTIFFNLHNRFWIVCKLQAFWMQLFELASIFNTGAIAFYLLNSIIFRLKGRVLSVVNGFWIIVAWTIPIIMAVTLFPLGGYGPSGPWCWVNVVEFKFFFFYNYLFVIVILNILIYIAVFTYLSLLGRKVSRTNRHTVRFARSLLAYMVVFFGVWSVPVIYRLLSLAVDVDTPLLVIPMTILNPCGGIFNGLIYGYFARVHQSWLKWIDRKRRTITTQNPLSNKRPIPRNSSAISVDPLGVDIPVVATDYPMTPEEFGHVENNV
ncbi:Slime mold cyclic AMP receptor [Carpediemonas membranifera]|uniref:Slime mold cyclic AMP receptor n=1 Tax=Carpediemonas membranifera TaxID=201153 RepID=A0A8J6B0A2_9EUKA|nr:Slime mold cyclic AMP receptor [Carpediemonas membranifera]|eukprot:KAG9390227.1 Slime mold cyclic AMP receptor [Carpediemonas membranifera]